MAPPPAPAPEAPARTGRGERAGTAVRGGRRGRRLTRRHRRNGLLSWHVSADAASPPLPLHARPPRVGASGENRRLSNARRRRVCPTDGRTWRAFCGTPGAQADQRDERACTDCRDSHRATPAQTRPEAPIALPRAGWTRAANEAAWAASGRALERSKQRLRASATERRRARSNLAQAGGQRRCSAAQLLQRVRPWFRWGWAWRLPLRRRWPARVAPRARSPRPPCRRRLVPRLYRRVAPVDPPRIRAGQRDAKADAAPPLPSAAPDEDRETRAQQRGYTSERPSYQGRSGARGSQAAQERRPGDRSWGLTGR